MSIRFRDIEFPSTYKYSSDSEHIPLEFYEETFPIAKTIDLMLGYFSSNAIKVLSRSFARFIFHGGSIRIITNHIFSVKDKENLIDSNDVENEDQVLDIFGDIESLEKELSDYGKHFFDCLRFLKSENRLQILPVKFNGVDLAHCKKMILFDGVDYISTDGSINFTLNALTKNSESFEVNAPWEGEIFKKRTELEIQNFERIFRKEHPKYEYLDSSQLEVAINKIGKPKDIKDLLEDSLELEESSYSQKVKSLIDQKKTEFENYIAEVKGLPRFPYPTGAREYQEQAYKNWVRNDKSGVFAMATGTGKTITSLNCLLEEYKETSSYKAIILVPSIALLNQWEEEVKQFYFTNILKVGGGSNWERPLANYISDLTWGTAKDLVIISTYGSFSTNKFQKYFKKLQSEFMLIADEAHNLGAKNMRKVLATISVKRKIALSATPKRIYDPSGTDAIDSFFNDTPPYTYNFGMEKALQQGFLTEYNYYPIIVQLNEDEQEQYVDISRKLLKYFDFDKGEFKSDPMVEILLMKRKNIVHRAGNKISAFKGIIQKLDRMKKLEYVFTYVPEGFVTDEKGESSRIIDSFLIAGNDAKPGLKMNTYTSLDEKLDEILKGFTEGKIDVLFAMKMLDEGVDVPRAEVGIFCSSTGNPRQFIQRRGRLLRKHPEKAFATIFDMVVVPQINKNDQSTYGFERNMVKSELQRVGYFASLAMNYYDSKEELDGVCRKYELNLDEIIEEL